MSVAIPRFQLFDRRLLAQFRNRRLKHAQFHNPIRFRHQNEHGSCLQLSACAGIRAEAAMPISAPGLDKVSGRVRHPPPPAPAACRPHTAEPPPSQPGCRCQAQVQPAPQRPAAPLAPGLLLLAATAVPAWADEPEAAVSAASDAAASSGAPSPLGWALLASPVVFYAAFNVYRSQIDPRAKFGDAIFAFAALLLLANIISIVAFKTRLF